jgi:hypothetical protein
MVRESGTIVNPSQWGPSLAIFDLASHQGRRRRSQRILGRAVLSAVRFYAHGISNIAYDY